jgi:urease accessory protein
MKRASAIRLAGDWDAGTAVDQVVLDADERHCRRVMLTGKIGTAFLLDLAHATVLHEGDGLVLDDGTLVQVCGKPELLIEIAAANPQALTRLAWHLGNRHVDVQIAGSALRIRRDHVIEDMLRSRGASLTPIEASFEPEPGAYVHDDPDGNSHV